MSYFKRLYDLLITLLFSFLFLVFVFTAYWPVFLWALLSRRKLDELVRSANRRFLKMLFRWMKRLIPGMTISVPDEEKIAGLRSSVIICNHLSLLDPILIMSILRDSITIVKESWFRVPMFGWVLKKSGFFPASISVDGLWSDDMLGYINDILDAGGNLFVFPEGSRSRSGRLGSFKKGAFYFALKLNAPIEMLRITGTEALFPPGGLLDTNPEEPVFLRYIGRLDIPGRDHADGLRAVEIRDMAQKHYE